MGHAERCHITLLYRLTHTGIRNWFVRRVQCRPAQAVKSSGNMAKHEHSEFITLQLLGCPNQVSVVFISPSFTNEARSL
jgi:hypothetical protein